MNLEDASKHNFFYLCEDCGAILKLKPGKDEKLLLRNQDDLDQEKSASKMVFQSQTDGGKT